MCIQGLVYTSDKGLITRIYRELKKLNSPKTNEPIKKWACELNKYIILEFTLSTACIYGPPTPIPGVVSAGIIFAFTYMCTHFLHRILLSAPFPYHLPPPSSTYPSPGK
jgi:hypothetical protein